MAKFDAAATETAGRMKAQAIKRGYSELVAHRIARKVEAKLLSR